MDRKQLKQLFEARGYEVWFQYHGKPAGVMVEVWNKIPKYTALYGDDEKIHSDVDELMNDPFFDGQSLNDLADVVEFDVT